MPMKKEYVNEKEWIDALDAMKERIHSFICDLMDDEDEYNFMEQMGLTPKQGVMIHSKLEEELRLLGGGVHWAEKIASLIEFGVNRMIQTLMRCGFWQLVYGVSIPGDVGSLIYENIEQQIDNQINKVGVGSIHTIPCYRCKSCDTMTDTCFDDVSGDPFCPSCAEENGLDLDG